LYLAAALGPGQRVELGRVQANYLVNVLRMAEGAEILVFNGRDGEWMAKLVLAGRKTTLLEVLAQRRPQYGGSDLYYLFAPLKHARLDYVVQKAVEMGVNRLLPVLTQHTQVSRVNRERMRANVIEAAEQCGILRLPEVEDEASLGSVLETWPEDRWLIYCDEDAPVEDPIAALRAAAGATKLAVLIGPEGGFDEAERQRLLRVPRTVRLSLGPRILRADTAAVAALALVQAVLGDGAGDTPAQA
jgi:16S rRNA (uracil1498-N3)-methyltransferase